MLKCINKLTFWSLMTTIVVVPHRLILKLHFYIYSTNIDVEYFKRGIYSPFFLFKMQFVS